MHELGDRSLFLLRCFPWLQGCGPVCTSQNLRIDRVTEDFKALAAFFQGAGARETREGKG